LFLDLAEQSREKILLAVAIKQRKVAIPLLDAVELGCESRQGGVVCGSCIE
jgi:hypothetical protein